MEATEFMGKKLTPIREQNNNALRGTQVINRDAYRLTVDGLVDNPLSLSYTDLQAYPKHLSFRTWTVLKAGILPLNGRDRNLTLYSMMLKLALRPELLFFIQPMPRAIPLWI